VKLIVKVDVARTKDPAAHVRQVLRAAGADGKVEEVFPDLRSGASAGLVSITLSEPVDVASRERTIAALRADDAIVYVETPSTRRPRS
jgi:hypothetical protein